jgi:hypothetical protein
MKSAASTPRHDPAPLVVQTDGLLGTARVLHLAGCGAADDVRFAHLCLDAGQSRPLHRGSGTMADRTLGAWLVAILLCAAMVAMLIETESRATQTTAQMMQLAAQLEHTATIPAQTADEIERVLRQPWYDKAAREHLKSLLASKEIAGRPGATERVARSWRPAQQLNF